MKPIRDVEERIGILIGFANPEGENFQRLKRLQSLVRENVMLTVRDLNFLQELQDVVDKIECDFVTETGWCKEFGNECSYTAKRNGSRHNTYASCPAYKKPRGGQ